jgi:hypothetical protein
VTRPRRRTVGISLLVIALVILAVGAGGFLWFTQPQPLLPEAATSQASTSAVTYTEVDGRLEWTPAGASPTTGLVVYPGAKVPAAGYGPLARDIAESGYLVVVMEMPFNFAIFDINAADRAITAHPEIAHWAIGGHSLGGAMAAQYTSGHVPPIEGLALWASYSASDLSALPISVVSIYGSLDAGKDKITSPESKALLPADTVYVEIPGGNHEQIGWYTGQPNDPPATIARKEQQQLVADATVQMLATIAAP